MQTQACEFATVEFLRDTLCKKECSSFKTKPTVNAPLKYQYLFEYVYEIKICNLQTFIRGRGGRQKIWLLNWLRRGGWCDWMEQQINPTRLSTVPATSKRAL